jgi:hypothetical protein
VYVIYLEFQKAFNLVSHTNWVLKLRALGIADKIYSWTED